MIGKKLIFLAIVAGILMMQLAPAFARHTGTGGTGDDDDEETAMTPQLDLACLFNFGLQAFFTFVTQVLTAVGACVPTCDTGVGPCFACFATNFPAPPTIPDCTVNGTA